MKISIIAAALGLVVASHPRATAQAPFADDFVAAQTNFSIARSLAAPAARFATTPRAAWAQQDPADSIYRLARQALSDQDYAKAASLFATITSRYPK